MKSRTRHVLDWLAPIAAPRSFIMMAGFFVLFSQSACAEPVTLGGDVLQNAVAGKTVHLDTPLGVAIPITYHANGIMSGKAGVLEYFLGAEADRGRWWIADGKLCQKWFKWLDAQPSCMRLQQDGDRILWRRDDGVSGTARIVAGLPLGAASAPRALGGPIPAHPPASDARVIKTTLPVAKTLSAPVKATEQHRPAQPRHEVKANASAHVDIGDDGTINWCRSGEDQTKPTAHAIAIQIAAGAGLHAPTNACFSAQPGLWSIARLDLSVSHDAD